MHYPRTAFSIDGSETITPVDPNAQIGQRTALSAGDIAAANSLCSGGPTGTPRKIIDDGPITINKAIDDGPITINKFVDDGHTRIKVLDDGPRTHIKFIDDGPITINKVVDDGPRTRIKFIDDGPGTANKFVDDGGGVGTPSKFVDDAKSPARDIGRPFGPRVPFALATPHHASAAAVAAAGGGGGQGPSLDELVATIEQLDAHVSELVDALQQGVRHEGGVDLQAEYEAAVHQLQQALALYVQIASGQG
jgi:hypothetical protein